MVELPKASVQSMTSAPEGTEVQVEVVGPKVTPQSTKELRARARALMDSGILPAARKSVDNITMGELERLTEVEGSPITEDRGNFQEASLFTVIVKGEQ